MKMVLKILKFYTRIQKRNYSSNKLYSSTVLLPKTKVPLKLEGEKLVERDGSIYKTADFDQLYFWQRSHLSEPEFVLHDGPPYANGNPHMGHAMNKILKDTILRYQIICGHKVHYIPGWDCHGLPIELKAVSNTQESNPLVIREKAQNFASRTIEQQKEIFKYWGVIGDWRNPYTTYSVDYIKNQFRQFFKLYKKDLVYRAIKPIYWSPSSRTALAESELEYNENHKSPSAYVRFLLKDVPHIESLKGKRIFAIIWTTTPWTLPSNQAICYNRELSYSLVKRPDPQDKDIYIVATELVEQLSKELNCSFQILGVLSGEILEDATYTHCIYKDQICKFLKSSHVMATKGTGLVHTAPAHGPEDFLVALEHKMFIVDMVDETGCYKPEAGPNLSGKFVLTDGNETVLKLLGDSLMHLENIVHSYPYDWRTKQPVIIKASQQWFVDTYAIKGRAIELLEGVRILPKANSEKLKNNMIQQIQSRPYWCISRQRKWGVPIPALYDNDDVVLDEDLLNNYLDLLDKEGTDFWWRMSIGQLVPRELHYTLNMDNIVKGEDIFDIWFDSGISWSKVLEGNKIADLYLEGADQFNGWFQSALITSVGLRDKVPYKSIFVHGFAVDAKGIKMSKSIGNVIDPVDITRGSKKNKPFGVDVLRWWVCCHANQEPIAHVSHNVLQSSAEEIQKIRSALRFALGSIYDYDGVNPEYEQLLIIDKYMLHYLLKFENQVKEALKDYEFQKICSCLLNLISNQISALYYTSIKDRLYCELEDSVKREAAQYVQFQILKVVIQSIAPIIPHLAEELYFHMPQKQGKTYFTSKHTSAKKSWNNDEIVKIMDIVLQIKKDINKSSSATNNLVIALSLSKQTADLMKAQTSIEELEQQLVDIFQVSRVQLSEDNKLEDDYVLTISESSSFSCPRCRKIQSEEKDQLCKRCFYILDPLSNKKVVEN